MPQWRATKRNKLGNIQQICIFILKDHSLVTITRLSYQKNNGNKNRG